MPYRSQSIPDRQTPYFDKSTTAILKGIALLMMFVHHFFTLPTAWIDGIEYPFLEKISEYTYKPPMLCVPVFCFLTGYFYYYNKDKTYSYSLRKISDILIDYWGVFFLLALIAATTVHYVYSPVNFIKEMFALYRPTMVFCWYVYFYCIFMLLLPSLTKLLSNNVRFDLFFSVVALPMILDVILYVVRRYIGIEIIHDFVSDLRAWFPGVLIGYIFAQYKLFDRMAYLTSKLISSQKFTIIMWFIGALFIPMGKFFLPSITIITDPFPVIHKPASFVISMDAVYAPVFIFCVANLCRNIRLSYVQFVLEQIGNYSLLMWFVSCIFYNNSKRIFQPILYWPHNPVLVLIWGLLICYLVSVVLDKGLGFIIKQKNKLLFHKV